MTFNEKLKMLRTEKKVSQQIIAEYLGVTKQAYSLYELGKRDPDYTVLLQLSEYFDVSLDYLIGKTDIRKPIEDITDDDIKVALFDGAGEITDEMWAEVKSFARFVQERERKKIDETEQ